MKKYAVILLVLLIIPNYVMAKDFEIHSNNAILYNYNDNEVLYKKNSDEKVSIASMTKLLTALTVVKSNQDLKKEVTIKKADFNKVNEFSLVTAGFKEGDNVTYLDLLYGLLFSSGAECANALANNTYSNSDEFVNKMNIIAKEIGMKNTHMNNPIGYDEDNHYSTVNDVYKLFKYCLENKTLKEILTEKKYITSNKITLNNKVVSKYNNQNNLGKMVAGKTGTTKKAGYALVSLVKKDDVNLILVTTNTSFDNKAYYNYQDASYLYNYFLSNYSYKNIITKKQTITKLNTKYAKEKYAYIVASKSIKKYLKNDSKISYKYEGLQTIKPNIKETKKIGRIEIYVDNEKVKTVDAYLKNKVTFSLYKFIKANKLILLIILLLITLIIRKNCKVRKKRRKRYLKKR